MSTARWLVVLFGLLVVAPIATCLGLVVWVQAQLPAAQSERVRGDGDIVGVQTGGSYAWVVPSATGVLLVDAGLDPTGKALSREIGQRPIRGVLLTHGHGDHTAGLAAFPAAPVYVTAEDQALLDGTRVPRGWLAAAFARMFGKVAVHGPITRVRDGDDLHVDGRTIRVVGLPGHTDGSVAYLCDGTLFTGDAVLGGTPLSLPPASLDDDPAAAEQSVKKLLPLDFDGLADGHVGFTGAARPALFRLANERAEPPTISVRASGPAGLATERTGVYVQSPVDARGEAPALVVFADGTSWRLADAPVPGREEWDGKAVVVRGRPEAGGAGPGLRVELESVALAPSQPSADRPLSERIGEWVGVRGTVRRLDALSPGAAWGDGELLLDDGSLAALSAPLAIGPAGTAVALRVRVERGQGPQLRLIAAPLPPAP